MFNKWGNIIIFVMLIISLSLSTYFLLQPKKVEVVYNNYPAAGTPMGTEEFRGCEVPVVADGRGGKTYIVTDVPWDKFSIQEKLRMAAGGGNALRIEDIALAIEFCNNNKALADKWREMNKE